MTTKFGAFAKFVGIFFLICTAAVATIRKSCGALGENQRKLRQSRSLTGGATIHKMNEQVANVSYGVFDNVVINNSTFGVSFNIKIW